MYLNASAIYGLRHQARALAAQSSPQISTGDANHHRFIVGSMNIREENEIHLIEYNEDSNDLLCMAVYAFPHEVWHLSPSPSDAWLVFASHNDGEDFKSTLLCLPEPSEGANEKMTPVVMSGLQPVEKQSLEEVMSLPPTDGPVSSLLWAPVSDEAKAIPQIACLDHHNLKLWDISSSPSEMCAFKVCEASQAACAVWDRNQPTLLLTANDLQIQAWDIRQQQRALHMPSAHRFGVCAVDCNPNRPSYFVTSGQDRMIKFWDMRNPAKPIKVLCGHTHWVWTVQYNRFHDQLLISAGTDGLVNLWRVSSISSVPLLDLDGENGNNAADSADTKIRTFDEQRESVYSIAWSACDAWLFASLSYDGKVVLNHVPSTEKYKILL